MQVHYTTYDLRHEYDTINPRTHRDVMVLSGETTPSHPYWYARVLGIYHMEVWLSGGAQPVKRHLEVLWEEPLVEDILCEGRFSFEPSARDPSKFVTSSLRYRKSLARPGGYLDDWEEYYVGIFVDRDMFMRYTHLGVGHSPMLWKIIMDCLGPVSVALADPMDDVDLEEAGNGEGYEDEDDEDNEDEDDEDEDNEECEEVLNDGELDEGAMGNNDGDEYNRDDQYCDYVSF
ncbi:hypothetical protein EDD22DRAFT_961140 [Suillus occidentalis]|nr:hypothetical protein EDD22DRAFT_961140 [Suillus occidentalis]